jgi:hypothetical protein
MTSLLAILLFAASAATESGPALQALGDSGMHLVDRGPGALPIAVPVDEELVYKVKIDVGILGTGTVGRVTLSSGVDRVLAGLPRPGEEPQPDLEVPWIRTYARGSHFGYDLEHELYVRILPQKWPRFDYRDTHRGSENKIRYLKLGVQDGKSIASYQRNKHCQGCERLEHFVKARFFFESDRHCPGCKRAEHRVWTDPPLERAVPADSVDMLSAVFLGRTMVMAGLESTTFHLVDREELWEVTVVRGELVTVETPSGRYRAHEVELLPRKPAGEPRDEDERFEGLFGIRGTIKVYLEQKSGVPVRISGEVPLGIFSIDVIVELESYRGTPPGFGPLS